MCSEDGYKTALILMALLQREELLPLFDSYKSTIFPVSTKFLAKLLFCSVSTKALLRPFVKY